MDKASAPKRIIMEEEEASALPAWEDAQASLAASAGLAILLVEGHQPPSIVVTNNNSICHAFQSSPAHAHLCDPYCGEAFNRAMSAGGKTYYKCHAGMHCFTMPVKLNEERKLAVIGGRAFLQTSDYRELVERFRAGDLRDIFSPEVFRNVIFAALHDLENLAVRVNDTAEHIAALTVDKAASIEAVHSIAPVTELSGDPSLAPSEKINFPLGQTIKEACRIAIQSLAETHGLISLALMLRHNKHFALAYATEKFRADALRIHLEAKDPKLIEAAKHGKSLNIQIGSRLSSKGDEKVEVFPLTVGDEVKGALLVGDGYLTEKKRRSLSAFCREIALPLEVLRLREELERRSRASHQLHALTERLNTVEPAEAYTTILRHSAELLRAERGSLLLFDETANELEVKAAVGPHAEIARDARVRLGDGVAGAVMSEGRPLVVPDLAASGRSPAPAERRYKTGSFISYPIIIGGRKVGVLNVTDKAGGGTYDEFDLDLLEMIAPQMALALDRAEWHQKATQFQLLSITDSLTGLLNRRYLEERLSEELERSKRHRFSMSFMMIDIDDFKHYNDRNGHQAGDLALEMTAQCLKSALRSADVASRYGGEEFSILLPQTNFSEAQAIAERIRRRVERTQYPHGKAQPLGAVTVSIGISAFGPKLDTPASIIGAADHALYVAKSRGKNRVEPYSLQTPASVSTDAA